MFVCSIHSSHCLSMSLSHCITHPQNNADNGKVEDNGNAYPGYQITFFEALVPRVGIAVLQCLLLCSV